MGFRGKSSSLAQLAFVVAPSFILFGYNQAGVGGLLSLSDWTKTFPQIDTTNTTGTVKSQNATIQGVVVATFVLGALTGSLSCVWLGDPLGRRKLIFAAALFTLIGEAICCSSFQLAQFIVGRTIIGLGVGILTATVPVWQSECSSAAHRGKHVVLEGCFICVGYVLEAWINLGFSQIKDSSMQWRFPLAIPMIFSMVLMATIFFQPESPRWLMRKGRVQEAKETISMLYDLPLDDTTIVHAIEGIEASLVESSDSSVSLRDLFTSKEDKLLYRFSLCILLQFYQQMSGSNLISVYTPVIFQQGLSMSSETSRILAGAALTWKFLSCFVAFFTIDRFGRRALFMFSGFGMGASMLALAVAMSFPKSNLSAQIAAVFFVFTYQFFVPIGFLGANFLYCTEIAPIRLRVAMSSISTSNHFLWNFVIIMVTPIAITNIGYRYYIVYCVISFCIPISIYLFYPETMGQNLEDIELMFRESGSAREVVKKSLVMAKVVKGVEGGLEKGTYKAGSMEVSQVERNPRTSEKVAVDS